MHHRSVATTRKDPLQNVEDPRRKESRKSSNGGKTVRRRTKRSRKGTSSSIYVRMVCYIIASGLGVFLLWKVRFTHTVQLEGKIEEHVELYETVYRLARDDKDTPANQKAWPKYGKEQRPSNLLASTYGPNVTKCDLTVLFMDPRLGDPTYGPGQAAWFALESVGNFADQACVLLLTSSCTMQTHLEENAASQHKVETAVRDAVYDASLPLFRGMIDAGLVRLGFLDVDKYGLHSCSDYGNPTAAFVNIHFWKDEFLEGIDSDLVLVLQDDAVLCRPVDLTTYRQFAYTGGVWTPEATKLMPDPSEGMCRGMPLRWKNWLLPQRRWERSVQAENGRVVPKPKELLQMDFPDICENGMGPIGNGGLSLRQRSWMIRAIATCPHVKYSGIQTDDEQLACKVVDQINEDFYFGVVLRGLQAPMPTALEASLFSLEMLWPEEALMLYGRSPLEQPEVETRPLPSVSFQGLVFSVPCGMHKPWWYYPNDLLRSDRMRRVCPFLKYIFEPSMSRWREFEPDKAWTVVGS